MTPNIHISQNEIKEMLIQFYNATGIRVGIHDQHMNILSEYPVKPEIFEQLGFCDVLRRLSPATTQKCLACDMRALEHVRQIKRSYVYKCHMGFTEAVIPILAHGEVISVLMMGQISPEHLTDARYEQIINSVKDKNIRALDPETLEVLRTSFDNIRCMDIKRFTAFAYLLEMCAQSIYDNRWIRCEEKTLIENIREYVEQNVYGDISISDAAEAMKISRSHLSRIVHNEEKTSYTKYFLSRKVEVAKRLLTTTTMNVKEISAVLKFNEPTYFMRVFKNITGMTCLAYRKKYSR